MRLGWIFIMPVLGWVAVPGNGTAAEDTAPAFLQGGPAGQALSPLGEAVRGSGGERWVQAQEPGITAHAFSPELAARAAAVAARARTDFEAYWGEKLPPGQVQVFIVDDDALWNQLVQDQAFRPDSLALELGNELFIKGGGANDLVARIPHEIVHYGLHRIYGTKMPLWLEEGLALHVGHGLTRQQAPDYREPDASGRSGLAFWRKRVDLAWVTAQERYPEEPKQARMYYRAIRNLIHEIEQREGRQKLKEFIRVVCGEGLTFDQAARKVLGWTIYDIAGVQNKLLARPSD